ncbi:hypothetical protein ACIBF7_27405 [Nonomuraea sp. NPDC050478]|uniref:hypothetical protein n=1 Tax=unclassified Nonomuraea TaxID=2593643 RepID=UPI00164F0B0A|nr:hypothetical protein [Nonomuraea sp. C10]
MSNKLQVAFAVLAGYCLGRRRKLRTAAALAAAGLAGRASCGNGGPLAQGVKALGSTPELQQLTERLRGELVEAGKTAVMTAASRQIDSLSQRLQERAGSLGGVGEAADKVTKQASRDEEGEEGEEEDYEEEPEEEAGEEEGEEEEAEEPARAKRPARTQEKAEGEGARRRTRPVRRAGQSRG